MPTPQAPSNLSLPVTASVVAAIAPTGTLRAGINLSNFLLVSDRTEDGTPIGVSPALAALLAETLGVTVEYITFANPGEVADAATKNTWDIGNIGADPARAEHIAFSSPYAEIDATYLVRAGSTITSIDHVDRPGVRVVSKQRAAYTLWLERHLQHAELILTDSIDASFERYVSDETIDVLGGLRPRLLSDHAALPGSTLLDGRFMSVRQAVGIPKDRAPEGAEFLETFVQYVVSAGHVASWISEHDVAGQLQPADLTTAS